MNFDYEISYINNVINSIEFEALSFKEQKVKLNEVLKTKLNDIYNRGVRIGERNIKTQLTSIINTVKEE